MSAFGQAGFGSRNRQNQLRAQGQMDPYGNQVRQAKQAPTFNIYSQQPAPSSRPATPRPQPASMPAYGGQPQTGGPTPTSPGVTQPSTPPAQPQTGGPFPTYDSVMGPQTGGPMPTMGQAQPIQPASTGTPQPQRGGRATGSQSVRQMATPENPLYGADGTALARIAAQFHNAGMQVPPELSQAVSQVQHNSLKSQYDARYVSPDMWRNASQSEKDTLLAQRDHLGNAVAGADGRASLNVWSQDQMQQFLDRLKAWRAPNAGSPTINFDPRSQDPANLRQMALHRASLMQHPAGISDEDKSVRIARRAQTIYGDLMPIASTPTSNAAATPQASQAVATTAPPTRFTGDLPQAWSRKTYEEKQRLIDQENLEIKARINLGNAGLLGRYIGDGMWEKDKLFMGYGGQLRYTDPGVQGGNIG